MFREDAKYSIIKPPEPGVGIPVMVERYPICFERIVGVMVGNIHCI